MPRARTSNGIKGHNDKVYSTYLAVNAAVMLRRSASRTTRCGATRRRIRTEDGHQPPCAHTARLSNPLLLALLIGVFIAEKHALPDRRTDLYQKGVGMMIAGGARANAKATQALLLHRNSFSDRRSARCSTLSSLAEAALHYGAAPSESGKAYDPARPPARRPTRGTAGRSHTRPQPLPEPPQSAADP